MKKFGFVIYVYFSIFSLACAGQKSNPISINKFLLETIYKSESKDVVWGFDFISKDELIISLKSGKLIYFNQKTKEKKLLLKPSVFSSGQGGLLDVHLKKIDNKNYIYFTYSLKNAEFPTTALSRGIYNNKSLKNIETIFKAQIKGGSSKHFGSRLLFYNDYIFMTIGDRGERKYAQNLSFHNGKILRLTLQGKAAKGNPYENTIKALPEIWSYGHRNPQGIDLNPEDNKIYSTEFGPRGGDELNLIKKNMNYGWPIITYGREYWGPKIGQEYKDGMEQPIVYWSPSISPSGMIFYRGNKIKEWKNNLFIAALGSTHLRRLILKNSKVTFQEVLFINIGERFRHVKNGRDGYLYFSTDSGKIVKIK